MKTSSFNDSMKTGQRRSASGHLFWGHLNVQNASVYFDTYRSHAFCGQSTAISQWKGQGKLGPAVEAKVLAALKSLKGQLFNVEKNLNARSVEFSLL